MMASADEIYLTIKGRGGHAASPHMVVDPISIASQIIVGLQQVVSRNANPEIPSVLSFGRIIGDGAMNVIPDQVVISGTFRTVDETWRGDALERIQTMAVQTARAMGADCEVHIDHGYPVVYNDEELTLRTRRQAETFLGSERVVDLPLVMWAEDFAYYGKQVPASFYNLGVANTEKGWNSPLHSPTLMIDEGALETGIGLMAFLACKELEEEK
jgi:amidohydrolase